MRLKLNLSAYNGATMRLQRMASWRRTFVVALGMCCFALHSQVQADESIVASFSDPLVKAWVQSAAVPTAATGINVSELPVARPG